MFKKIATAIILNSLALYAVVWLFSKSINYTGGLTFFIIGGIVIGLLNFLVKPIMKMLSFPLLLFSMGLFMIVINAIIFVLTIHLINAISIGGSTVSIKNTFTYIFASLILSIVNWVLHILFNRK